jgi:hypothetical protein
MSWRPASLVAVLALLVLACGGGSAKMKVKKGEPQTAREKMLAEEAARKKRDGGEDDEEAKPPGSKQWTGWRYQGDRNECFFVVGKKCFKTEKAACAAAACKAPSKCETEGAGPAQLSCGKVAGDEPKSDETPAEEPADAKPAKKSRKKKG